MWDVSNVKNMNCMFRNARSFNQPISCWDVSNLCNVDKIFENAISFNQDISNWNLEEKRILSISTDLTEFDKDKVCIICYENTNNNIIRINCCGKNYHRNCLIDWFKRVKSCPSCRKNFN